jgi:hypothetical protein
VSVVYIFENLLTYQVGIGIDEADISIFIFGSYFIAHMYQLSEVWIIILVPGNMSQAVCEFFS